jgi:hypothetical protein
MTDCWHFDNKQCFYIDTKHCSKRKLNGDAVACPKDMEEKKKNVPV